MSQLDKFVWVIISVSQLGKHVIISLSQLDKHVIISVSQFDKHVIISVSQLGIHVLFGSQLNIYVWLSIIVRVTFMLGRFYSLVNLLFILRGLNLVVKMS